jgi:hypothetical protein
MWPLRVVVVCELIRLLPDAGLTDQPRVMEAINPNFEGVKPFSDYISAGIVDPAAQS